jgi:hypothetical protein
MAYDAATGDIVLFGGVNVISGTGHTYGDTWTWNGSAWTKQHPATSPPARGAAAMTYAATGDIVLFGGNSISGHGHQFGDTWIWDGSAWTKQHPATSPTARGAAVMAYDAATSGIVLFGGLDSTDARLGDTWTWDGSTWTQQHPATSPPGRYYAAMAEDPATGDIVLFGGLARRGTALHDTWTWGSSS